MTTSMRYYTGIFLAGLLICTFSGITAAADDPLLIRIDNREITLSEFRETYKKNNMNLMDDEHAAVEEYLEMFIDFRLKVKEAKLLGMDTMAAFIDELAGYREQLARQYLVDHEVTEQLIKEAWERSQYDVRASHILVSLERHAPPEDTLAAWQKINDARERILGGEDFGELAREVSDDPSARDQEGNAMRPARPGNAGDLGYFSALHMVYPFENAAYTTPVGEVSEPFRTDFGYHIVRVTNRLPAMGEAHVAHIMLLTPPDMPEEELKEKERNIHDIYQALQGGEDFEELAGEHSEDRQSAQRGGEMPPFTANRMVPEFIEAIHTLDEPGQFSEPVRTAFGWHIIQLIDKKPPLPFEESYAELQNRIQRNDRAELGQTVVIERLKKEYGFQEDRDALAPFFDVVTPEIFQGTWDVEMAAGLGDPLFGFSDREFTQQDFARFLDETQRRRSRAEIPVYVHDKYHQFVSDAILGYENENLEEKYPEFASIMQEYHDGILLFEITDEKVWSKATTDQEGLEAFFLDNIDDYPADELREVRGMVIADYQNHLEKEWVAALREKYDVWVDRELLRETSFE